MQWPAGKMNGEVKNSRNMGLMTSADLGEDGMKNDGLAAWLRDRHVQRKDDNISPTCTLLHM